MTKRSPTVPQAKAQKAVAPFKKNDPVVLTGHEKLVDAICSNKEQIALAEAHITDSRTVLDDAVIKFRAKTENEGQFTKSVQVRGTRVNGVYTFKDAYAKIDVSVEVDMKRLLGNTYDALFKRHKTVTVKANCMDKLRELAQKHGFVDLLEEDEFLLPVDDFREKRFLQRDSLTGEQNRALDEVVRQVAQKPALSFK